MDFGPILSTLRRHKTAAALIILEVALTCAIVCNALFLIAQRLERIDLPTGLEESGLLVIRLNGIGRDVNADALTLTDLAALRGLPGVTSASVVSQFPFGNSTSITNVDLAPNQPNATLDVPLYKVGEDTLKTFGLHVVAGRDFLPGDYQVQSVFEKDGNTSVPVALINRTTAERLFPGQEAVGRIVYMGTGPTRIVGVIDRLSGPQPGEDSQEFSIVVPLRPSYRSGTYIVRVDPAQRATALKAAVAALERNDARRLVSSQSTLEDLRRDYFQQDRAMAWLLATVCLALLVVTAFGIVGLASFWVQQRTRMIGTRRALGASRLHILRYFQTENFLLTGIGIAIGMVAAYGINQLLMTHYELPRLPWTVLPAGAVVLWALGQIAVLGPALRAAALPPMTVMRGA